MDWKGGLKSNVWSSSFFRVLRGFPAFSFQVDDKDLAEVVFEMPMKNQGIIAKTIATSPNPLSNEN